jgi:hypothetical protein
LQQPGTLNITIQVQESELFGFDILYQIILILMSGIGLISFGAVAYCIYKCKRRRHGIQINEIRNDISFFDEYMPAKKIKANDVSEDICAVCLVEYK